MAALHESTIPQNQFWYFDDEMVSLTKARYAKTLGKKMQYVSAKLNGKLMFYDINKHVKINGKCNNNEFSLEPVFVNKDRDTVCNEHAMALTNVPV